MRTPYDAIADEWHASPRHFGARKYVELILSGLAPGARLLDVGCGTGEPVARYVDARGFRVVGVDESERMLEIARRVVPRAVFVRAGMCEMELDGAFAAAVAWDSVFHVGRDRHREVFRKLYGLLEPGGRLLLSAGGSGHEGFTSEMHGHDFFYSAHDPAETLRLLTEEGFVVELCEEDDPSSRGHIAVVASKPALKSGGRQTFMIRTESAGGVVIDGDGRVLVVSQHGTSWSLPKGHVEPGEELVEAARREVYEESGVRELELVRSLGSYQRHRIGRDGGEDESELKTIHMFLFRTNESELKPLDPENPEASWVERAGVAALLTHPKDREFFESVLDAL